MPHNSLNNTGYSVEGKMDEDVAFCRKYNKQSERMRQHGPEEPERESQTGMGGLNSSVA